MERRRAVRRARTSRCATRIRMFSHAAVRAHPARSPVPRAPRARGSAGGRRRGFAGRGSLRRLLRLLLALPLFLFATLALFFLALTPLFFLALAALLGETALLFLPRLALLLALLVLGELLARRILQRGELLLERDEVALLIGERLLGGGAAASRATAIFCSATFCRRSRSLRASCAWSVRCCAESRAATAEPRRWIRCARPVCPAAPASTAGCRHLRPSRRTAVRRGCCHRSRGRSSRRPSPRQPPPGSPSSPRRRPAPAAHRRLWAAW